MASTGFYDTYAYIYFFRIAVLLCGGNIDSNILSRCIERSLVIEGRLLKFSVMVSDRPGGVSEMCKILASVGASIKNIEHERAWLTSEVFQVIVSTNVKCTFCNINKKIKITNSIVF